MGVLADVVDDDMAVWIVDECVLLVTAGDTQASELVGKTTATIVKTAVTVLKTRFGLEIREQIGRDDSNVGIAVSMHWNAIHFRSILSVTGVWFAAPV